MDARNLILGVRSLVFSPYLSDMLLLLPGELATVTHLH